MALTAAAFRAVGCVVCSGVLWVSLGVVDTATACAQQGDQVGEPQPSLPAAWTSAPSPALSPDAALKAMSVEAGFRVELVASEPMVVAPVAMAFAPDGSLWVVQMPGFMRDADGTRESDPIGSVVRLTDQNGDGTMDRVQRVLDRLVLPRSVAFHEGGALVIEPPHLLWVRDGNGDGSAECVQVVASGFAGIDSPEHAGNALTWTHDHTLVPSQHAAGWRAQCGGPSDGNQPGAPSALLGSTSFTPFATPVEGQWGQAIDDFGRLYVTPNSDPLLVDLVPRRFAARTLGASPIPGVPERVVTDARVWPSHFTPGINRAYRAETLKDGRLQQVTAACGPVINRDIVLSPAWRGCAFVCEPSANLVARYDLVDNDAGVHASPTPEGGAFLSSTSERFRPCDLKIGPDGALYIADFSRGILQHRVFMTTFLRRQVDERGLASPTDQGRIWRVVPVDRPLRAITDLSVARDAALVDALLGPSGHIRDTAMRLIVERQSTQRVVALHDTAQSVAVDAAVRHSAACTLMEICAMTDALVETLSVAHDARLRADAAWFAGRMVQRDGATDERVIVLERLARDPARATAMMALCAMGELDDEAFIAAVLRLTNPRTAPAAAQAEESTRGANDAVAPVTARGVAAGGVLRLPWARASLASGVKHRALLLLTAMAEDSACDASDAGVRAFAQELTQQVLAHADECANQALLAIVARAAPTQPALALATLDRVAAWSKPASKDARRLRMGGQPIGWSELLDQGPDAVRATARQVDSQLAWPGRDGYALPKVEPTAIERGRLLYGNCIGCHQTTGSGMPPVYPPLRDSPFVTGDPSRLVRILLQGVHDELELSGVVYRGSMPAAPITRDDDLAALATWLRTSWGHASSPVDASFVARVRAADTARVAPWTVRELDAAPMVE